MYECQDQKIIKQYTACITNIARFDHPDKWSSIVPQISRLLANTADLKGLMTALLALKGLVKKYEYEMDKDRGPLKEVIEATFDQLGSLVDQLLSESNNAA